MGALALLVAYPLLALYRGFALTFLWGWFIVPAFGLAPLGLIYAVGLSIVASFLTNANTPKRDEKTNVAYSIAWSVSYTTVALAFGGLWSLFR